jgi:hypothetical protein
MNAVEFVKKYGWDQSWTCLSLCASPNDKWFIYNGDSISDSDFDELVKLVESYELVFEHGSLERAREYAESPYTAPEIKNVLLKAIREVEKCQ